MGKYNISFLVTENDIRLSEEIKKHVSRKIYKKIKSTNAFITVNNLEKKTFENVFLNDSVFIEIEEAKESNWPLYDSKLDIVYESDNYLIVNKRSGLLSIPTKSEPISLFQEVLFYLKQNGTDDSVSILNRLDKDTCGLCVIAKNRRAASLLSPTHENMVRKYYCLCEGIFDIKEDTITNYIDKDEVTNKRYVSDSGKLAISHYRVIKEYDNTSLVEFVLETGRTHQIRVHTSYLGHPIIGDKMYGHNTNENLKLCSYFVSFYDKIDDKLIEKEIGCDW